MSSMEPNKTQNQQPKKKKTKKKKNRFLQAIKIIFLLCLVLGIVGAGGAYFFVKSIVADIKPIDPSKIDDLLGENSVILDKDGRVLEQIQNDGLRTIIRYDEMSPDLINAFISVEDKTFREHNGFNFVRMAGAIWESATGKGRISGTSTITQQLARNLYLEETRSERSIDRKIKEAYYAIQLESHLTKEQIIEAYLNKIYLGSGSNGVEAAAQTFFSKDAKDLDLVESAMLAGIPKAPSTYSPMITKKKVDVEADDYVLDDSDELYTVIYNPKTEERYNVAIYLMYTNGYISEAEYNAAKTTDLKTRLHPQKTADTEITSYFADMVKSDVVNDLMEKYGYTSDEAYNLLYTKGLQIYSTIDFDLQKTLESAYSSENLTPYFDASTTSAIRAFQKRYGLSVDGSVGQGTLGKMAELGLVNVNDFSLKTYKKGMEHEDVVKIKEAMNELGLLVVNDNFPRVTVYFNGNKDIVSKDRSKLLLYRYENLVNTSKQLMIPSTDYKYDSAGNLVLLKGKRLNFYAHYQDGKMVSIQATVKNAYKYDENSEFTTRNSDGSYNIVDLYMHEGKDIFIPNKYKSYDDNNNLVIDRDFMAEDPTFFSVDGNGNLLIKEDGYLISDKGIIQPQSSMVIIDYHTGELKAIVGGRNITGQKIYNRAINPRQPGSSIKPIGVYLPAIESRQYTAASVIDDVPTYLGSSPSQRWPLNWYEHSSVYEKYWGLQTLRRGIEFSQNVLTVKLANELGVSTCYDFLKRFNFTTMVDSGAYNDQTLSSVALGGMTKGLTPLELTTAYGAMANGGVMNETITYTKVIDNQGNEILVNIPEKTKITDPQTAFIVQDMMRTGVTSGLSTKAAIRSGNTGIPVAGKTGTTSDKLDAWFVGYTPYYVAGVWFGNDVNMPLDQGSAVSANFWRTVMVECHEGLENKDFVEPDGLIRRTIDTQSGMLPSELSYLDPRGTVRSEIFIKGTEPTEVDNVHVKASICVESGKLANFDYCPTTLIEERVFVQRKDPEYNPEDHLGSNGKPIPIMDDAYILPTETCDVHNGELIETYQYNSTLDVINPVVEMADGSKIVQIPFYIELTNGSTVLIPIKTSILVDGTISLPDGSIILPSSISKMPDLDTMAPIKNPQTEPRESITDNLDVLSDEIDNAITE
ncbi:MAG: transglycosylase domain-containing protein [Clostridia bacterium]|nr:transglycosylase domain-containing protein [Clostridia bacterium]